MRTGELLLNSTEVRLVCLRQRAGAVEVKLRTYRTTSVCPSSGDVSSRVHSRYRRKLIDLQWRGLPVSILLRTRKFFCLQGRWPREIFTEQVPGTAGRYAQRSCRSSESLRWLTLALGGRVGSRLACKLGLLTGRTALLRELRQKSAPSSYAPRVLGIDEWAWWNRLKAGT